MVKLFLRVSLLIFLHYPFPAFSDLSYPFQDISLAGRGVRSPQEIGWLSLSVLHPAAGERIHVKEIARSRPLLEDPPGPRGRIPPFQGDFFLVSFFDRGNANRLGGYFNGFAKAPSESEAALGKARDGAASLIYRYHNILPSYAGLWIHLFDSGEPPSSQFFFDSTPFQYLTFSIRGGKGGEEFLLKAADRNWLKKEDSLAIGDLGTFLPSGKIENTWQQAWVPLKALPDGIDKKELASFTFLVKGNESGKIFLKDLAFTTRREVPIRSEKTIPQLQKPLRQALWLWKAKELLGHPETRASFLSFLKRRKITDLFLQIPYEGKEEDGKWKILWNPKPLQVLLSQLHRINIQAHALDGAPHFALKPWHPLVIALVENIIDYNRSVSSQERFGGIRFDIEPYLLSDFAGDRKANILEQYLALLAQTKKLTSSAGLALGADIPFWFDGRNEFGEPIAFLQGRPFSESIIDVVDNIGIMDYRTQAYGADGVLAHGEPEIRYAQNKGKKVFIGLETSPLPDETLFEFGKERREGSAVLMKKLSPDTLRIYWIPPSGVSEMDRILRESPDTFALYQTRSVFVPSSKLTFHNKEPKDLEDVMKQTTIELEPYSSFYGFAIHSYESYRAWLEGKGD